MKSIHVENGLIIKSWCNAPEEGAVEQARNLARLPFAFRQICLMPDAHQGYGMPIGGVMAAEGAIIPNAVGVDIGCGMCAVRTSLTNIPVDAVKKILGEIKVLKAWQLAFFPVDSSEGERYLHEMQYCVDFALANRKLMMDWISG